MRGQGSVGAGILDGPPVTISYTAALRHEGDFVHEENADAPMPWLS